MVLAEPVVERTPRVRGASSTSWLVLGTCAVVALLRLAFTALPLRSDEGGYLLVAREWRTGAEFLYGDYYVDRPPLLMVLYRLAALSDWDPAVRLLTIPFAVGFVLLAARTGRLLAGDAGARWAALTGAGLMVAPAIAADQADGELFAAPLAMAGMAFAVQAWVAVSRPARVRAAFLAGLFAGAAPTVKQNFLDGVVLLGVLVLAALLLEPGRRRRARQVAAAAGVGVLLPQLAVGVWVEAGGAGGVGSLWAQTAGFRASALEVIWSQRADAVLVRGGALLLLLVVSGLVTALATWALTLRDPGTRRLPLTWAVLAAAAYGLVSVALGGSYWPHYLLQLAPVTVVVVGLLAAGPTAVAARRCAVWVGASAAVGVLAVAVAYTVVPWTWFHVRTGEWLAASAAPGDTGFVAYGNPSILLYADMQSPYPHLWSLPMRTLDPAQERLERTLGGPQAPAWIVEVNPLNSWDIDSQGDLRAVVRKRYRVVATVCGNPVWLRTDLVRTPAPAPRC